MYISEVCNHDKHRVDQSTRESVQLAHTHQNTQELYNICHKVLSWDRDVFYPTLLTLKSAYDYDYDEFDNFLDEDNWSL